MPGPSAARPNELSSSPSIEGKIPPPKGFPFRLQTHPRGGSTEVPDREEDMK